MLLHNKRERVKCYSISLSNEQHKQAADRKLKENNKSPIRKKFDRIEKQSKIRAMQREFNKKHVHLENNLKLKIY